MESEILVKMLPLPHRHLEFWTFKLVTPFLNLISESGIKRNFHENWNNGVHSILIYMSRNSLKVHSIVGVIGHVCWTLYKWGNWITKGLGYSVGGLMFLKMNWLSCIFSKTFIRANIINQMVLLSFDIYIFSYIQSLKTKRLLSNFFTLDNLLWI